MRLRSPGGSVVGRLKVAPMRPGNLEVHWPEGNVIIRRGVVEPASGVPDYNAKAKVEKI
jgi:hypothetical protein